MKCINWSKELPIAITVCDKKGVVLEMNEKSISTFLKDGGKNLINTSMLDCHPQKAREKIEDLLKTQSSNVYTIEKNGMKKLIYQTPWYENGLYKGLVELSFEIPFEIPHFNRE
jgi:hypothetical protein